MVMAINLRMAQIGRSLPTEGQSKPSLKRKVNPKTNTSQTAACGLVQLQPMQAEIQHPLGVILAGIVNRPIKSVGFLCAQAMSILRKPLPASPPRSPGQRRREYEQSTPPSLFFFARHLGMGSHLASGVPSGLMSPSAFAALIRTSLGYANFCSH